MPRKKLDLLLNNKIMLRHYKIMLLVLQFVIVLISVSSCNQEINFEQNKWKEKTDNVFPSMYRPQMLNDLTTNHKLVGLSYNNLIQLLGIPDNTKDNLVSYSIIVDYGSDIDPIYSKDLEFTYSKDSIITSFRIKEWKK